MNQAWLISKNIFKQLLRNRILSVLFLFGLSAAGLCVFLADLGTEAEQRLTKDFGLLAIEWIGFFTVLLCHVVLLFEETELKTVSLLLVKPIQRWQYLLGKILGSVLLLGMNQLGMLMILGLIAWSRHYELVNLPFLLSTLYLFFEVAFFSIIITFFTLYSSTVPACAVFAVFTFILGHFTTNLLEWVQMMEKKELVWLVKGLYYLVPNLSLFDLKETLSYSGATIDLGTFLWPLAYALTYGGAVLGISIIQFRRKEY